MNFLSELQANVPTIGLIAALMALFAAIEAVIPLHPRDDRHRAHLAPNLVLTLVTFASSAVFNAALVLALASSHAGDIGVLPALQLPAAVSAVAAVVILDFSFYVAHVAMHKAPWMWRFHRIHHSDPVVDVTTTIRQHPGEGVIRYTFMAAFALAIGASPAAFAVYRGWSALQGLFEHANIRVPAWLDRALVLAVSTPDMHKVHHSRIERETDTNYGNLFSFFDRLFGTFTPSTRGRTVVCGLDDFAAPEVHSSLALLAAPFRPEVAALTGTGAKSRGLLSIPLVPDRPSVVKETTP